MLYIRVKASYYLGGVWQSLAQEKHTLILLITPALGHWGSRDLGASRVLSVKGLALGRRTPAGKPGVNPADGEREGPT